MENLQSKERAILYATNPANRTIITIPILLVASFIFYVLSGLFSVLGGGDSVADSIIAGVADSNVADAFSKIQVGMRVMPSHKTEGNLLLLVPGNGSAEHQGDYDGDFSDSITDDYFTTDSMEDYFPEFQFNENTVPLGNAKPFCVHLDWSTKANRKVLDRYYSVQDFPQCKLAQNPKFRWQATDPTDGLDFSLWRQYSKKVQSADECDSYGIFVKSFKSGGTCYNYEITESFCIAVSFKVNEESATYGWSYEGGCFEDGRIANYIPAVPGRDYSFDKLDFEVREYDPSIAEKMGSFFSLTGLFSFLAVICLIGALVHGGLFVYQNAKARKQQNANANEPGHVEMVSEAQ